MGNRALIRSLIPALAITAVLALSFIAPSRNFPFNGLLVGCAYGYGPTAPAVTGVTPNTGSTSGGTTVSITGSGFCGVTSVKFGTTAATSFTVQSNTLISAVSPAHAAGTVDVTVTNPAGTSATSGADQFTYVAVLPKAACSTAQYTLTGSDGSTWVTVDATYLSLTFTPTVDSYAVLGGNADMWTSTGGINQDLGIMVAGTGFPTTTGQPEAWKESGGSGGTFSPNAAFVQSVFTVAAGQTYTAKLVWKANVANSGSIWIGAGPINGKFSTTCVNVRLVPVSSASVFTKASTSQYTQTGSDGSTWKDMDIAGNLSLTFTTPSAGVLLASGNSDLWTSTAGYNQDIGITVQSTAGGYPTTTGQPEAWKESGGFAGTFSPNAAYVQDALTAPAGTYSIKIQWKANKADPGTIWAGAGPIGGKFSPTRITAIFLPTGSTPIDKVSTLQYHLTGNDGSTWSPVDLSKFTLSYTPTNDCEVIVGGNVDLWTSSAGYNQDAGIFISNTGLPTVYGQPEAWKESGGFNGTYSPNAAYVQWSVILQGGHSYTFELIWKANKADPGTIWAGAGPINGAYSPTRLTLQPVGC